MRKNKLKLFIFLAIDIALIAIAFWEILRPSISIPFGNSWLLNPQGIIALKERNLTVTAVLIMLIAVIPAYFMLFFFAWKYRAGKSAAKYSPDMDGKRGSWLIWLIPGSIIFVLSIINWQSTHALDPTLGIASNKKPLTIEVVALQWKFLFIYPEQNIATVNFIDFPAGTPLNFELTADAPMSSFWIPQLGSQIFAMAGMQTQLNLMANTTGDFRGMDTEINGAGFSGMKFIARSTSQSDFDQWIKSVQSSQNKLNLDVYNNLAQPSQNNPQAYYASVDPGLYDTIMMKNMMPMTQTQMQQMSSYGISTNASSTMNMQGMDMASSSPMTMPGMDMK